VPQRPPLKLIGFLGREGHGIGQSFWFADYLVDTLIPIGVVQLMFNEGDCQVHGVDTHPPPLEALGCVYSRSAAAEGVENGIPRAT
jgi:hypothetical protein